MKAINEINQNNTNKIIKKENTPEYIELKEYCTEIFEKDYDTIIKESKPYYEKVLKLLDKLDILYHNMDYDLREMQKKIDYLKITSYIPNTVLQKYNDYIDENDELYNEKKGLIGRSYEYTEEVTHQQDMLYGFYEDREINPIEIPDGIDESIDDIPFYITYLEEEFEPVNDLLQTLEPLNAFKKSIPKNDEEYNHTLKNRRHKHNTISNEGIHYRIDEIVGHAKEATREYNELYPLIEELTYEIYHLLSIMNSTIIQYNS